MYNYSLKLLYKLFVFFSIFTVGIVLKIKNFLKQVTADILKNCTKHKNNLIVSLWFRYQFLYKYFFLHFLMYCAIFCCWSKIDYRNKIYIIAY